MQMMTVFVADATWDFIMHLSRIRRIQKGQQKNQSWKCRWESCSTTDTGTEFDVSFEIDQSELEQVSVCQYETHTSDQNTC